jgi:biopolymer transport protein ExbB
MVSAITRVLVQSGAAWVLYVLFALSVMSLAIVLERAAVFRRAGADAGVLVRELRKLLRHGEVRRAAQLLQGDSTAARVVSAGLAEHRAGPRSAEEAMAASMGLERTRLESRLLFLGTVGNNAPFIGLLGTVIGVVGAFDALGATQAAQTAAALAPERVMSAIAEALVATAVGLVVGIPAVATFNYFSGRLTRVLADAETLGHVLLAYLKDEHDVRRVDSDMAPRPAAAGDHAAE